jgi:hypothetical protein
MTRGSPGGHALRLSMAVVLGGCVAGQGAERSAGSEPPPPSSSQLNALGYDDAVALGASYAQSLGYQYDLAEAQWTGGQWKVRFRLHDGTELKELQLKIDALTRRIVESEPRVEPRPDAGVARRIEPR